MSHHVSSRCALAALAVSLSLVVSKGTAQEAVRADSAGSAAGLPDRPTEITPRSGPPGTTIEIRASQLPALTPVHVAIGGTRSGFEGLAMTLTDQLGDLSVAVRIPPWARHDRTHLFIVFDAYFAPLAVTDLFHVTSPEGTIIREGEIIDAGPTCASMSGVDDEVYRFVGRTEGLDLGRRVVVEATVADPAKCPGGIPVEIVRLR